MATLISETINTTSELRTVAAARGSHFFDRDALRFFRSRIHSAVYAHRYFVTSEQHISYYPEYQCEPRAYTVREFTIKGPRVDIRTVGEFQEYATRDEAHAAAQALARKLMTLTPVEISNACLAAQEALMWSSVVAIDENTVIEASNAHANWSDDAIECIDAQVRSFLDACKSDRTIYSLRECSAEQLGHDFILTKNGHGTGFWDRGLGQLGERLSYWARTFGSDDVYINAHGELELN